MSTEPQLEFRSLIFADRRTITVREMAIALEVTQRHITDLIESGALGAIDVGSGDRHCWRIPISAYQDFLMKRRSV